MIVAGIEIVWRCLCREHTKCSNIQGWRPLSFFKSLKACHLWLCRSSHSDYCFLLEKPFLWAGWHFQEDWSLNLQPLHCSLQAFASPVTRETITRSQICVNIFSLSIYLDTNSWELLWLKKKKSCHLIFLFFLASRGKIPLSFLIPVYTPKPQISKHVLKKFFFRRLNKTAKTNHHHKTERDQKSKQTNLIRAWNRRSCLPGLIFFFLCIWPWRGHPLIGLLSPPLCAFRSENFLPYVKVGGQGY